MQLSFAPMEGISSYIFRRIHNEMFPGADRYYSPFIAPDGSGRFKTGSLRDVLPENNEGLTLIPQLLCNCAEPFLAAARVLADLGYTEVNLNAGCPSGTVVAKHKGAGMLRDLNSLDNCLADIFSQCPLRVSIKTRLGMESADEFPAIMEIYRKYPLAELIVHVRARSGMYRSEPDTGAFREIAESCPFPLTYNGDIFTADDADKLRRSIPGDYGIMTGRGAVANPALPRMIHGGRPLKKEELCDFHAALEDAFLSAGLDARISMARLKELWFYWQSMFAGGHRNVKAILKSRQLDDYNSAVSALFSECGIDENAHFSL